MTSSTQTEWDLNYLINNTYYNSHECFELMLCVKIQNLALQVYIYI